MSEHELDDRPVDLDEEPIQRIRILADDTPAVWVSNRPAKGGDAGAMLAEIIERAAKLKSGRAEPRRAARQAPRKAAAAKKTVKKR